MTLAIMQPYLFPYIGYWQLINAVETFVIYDDVTFIKQGYINRNSILINRQKQRFTLNLIGTSSNRLINQIIVGNNQAKLLKTMEQSYAKAPFVVNVMPILEQILNQNEKNLAKFLGFSLQKISDYLQINTEFIYSSDIKKDVRLKAQNKVIDIAKRLNAAKYINAIGGQKLYSKEQFKKEGIELNFLKTQIEEYKQFNIDFIPNLSIIDIMMFNTQDEIQKMLKMYELV
jgi:hypothetical protein